MAERRHVAAGRAFGTVVLGLTMAVAGLVTASAAPSPVPSPVRQLAAAPARPPAPSPTRTGTRTALHVAGDQRGSATLTVDPGCAPDQGKATAGASVVAAMRLKLDYVLTGTGLRKAGTVRTKPGRVRSLKLPGLQPGSYRLTVAEHRRTEPLAAETFDVFRCVQVRTGCHTLTISNPSPLRAWVSYRGRPAATDPFHLELAPGASRTVRVDSARVEVEAGGLAETGVAELGSMTVKVEQGCDAPAPGPGQQAVQTSGVSSCGRQGRGAIALSVMTQPSVERGRYEVLDAQQKVVLTGSFTRESSVSGSLPPGAYTYRAYAGENPASLEELDLLVLACAELRPACDAFEVVNPNDVPLPVFASGGERFSRLVAAANGTTSFPWSSPVASVMVGVIGDLPYFPFYAEASAPSDEYQEIFVPHDC